MEITFINVGYGDAIFIINEGYKILIDGGSGNSDEYDGFKKRIRASDYLKQAGINELDLLVITHIHEDHVCGLEEVIQNIPVKKIWMPYPPEVFLSGETLRIDDDAPRSAKMFTCALNALCRILKTAKQKNIPIEELCFQGEDKTITPYPSLKFTVLAPESNSKEFFLQLIQDVYETSDFQAITEKLTLLDSISNEASLFLKLTNNKYSILLAADSCPHCWKHLKDIKTLKADVFKLPHHGQVDSITEDTLVQIAPKYVITTSSSDRRYNSSNEFVYQKIIELSSKERQTVFLFTDEQNYLPYFSHEEDYNGLKLIFQENKITTEFILYKNY